MNNQCIKGIKYALFAAVISGLANFLNKQILVSGVDAVTLNVVKNGIAGLILLGVSFPLLSQLRDYSLRNWSKLILIAIVGGCIPFILFFKGLAISPAVVGSFIHKTLFIFVAILAVVFLRERVSRFQLAGLGIMFAGLLPIIKFNLFSIGRGEIMMLAAVAFWSVEAILIKKFIQDMDYRILAVSRMVLGTIFIAVFSVASGNLSGILRITPVGWVGILIASIFLSGYVYFWYKAFYLAPANVVTSVLTLALPVTIIASSIRSISLPAGSDLATIIFIAAGVCLYIKFSDKPWILSVRT